jgi:hypothetical protein
LQHEKTSKSDVSKVAIDEIQLSPAPPQIPNSEPRGITGCPFGRQDWPEDPDAEWRRHAEEEAEEAAARNWLVGQISGENQ